MDALEKIKTMSFTDENIQEYRRIKLNEKILRDRYGVTFDFQKNVRVQLMKVQSKLYSRSFKECCLKHLQEIDKRARNAKWLTDKIFIFLIMDEHQLFHQDDSTTTSR